MNRTIAAFAVAFALAAQAEIKTRDVDYKEDGTQLKGFFAWDDAVKGKRPGVLVIHEWWGENDHAHNQAKRLAKEGYVAFALDMYGNGKTTTHPNDAQGMMQALMKDPSKVKARFDAAMAELKKDPNVDGTRIGAVGYCMGGGIALSMALAGADLKAVSVFHSAPPSAEPKKGAVKAQILVNQGTDDPMAPPSKFEALKKQVADSGGKMDVIAYPGAKHGFTNPEADKAGVAALAYNADADQKSWEATTKLFKEALGR